MNLTSKHSWWTMPVGLLFLALFVAVLTACSSSPPRIVVQPKSQDLGERPQALVELTYQIRNEGGSPLRVEKISTSCDCTKATIDRTTIPPGQSTDLHVTLDPTEDNLHGELLRVIYIRSNDPAQPEVEAEFHVNILEPGNLP